MFNDNYRVPDANSGGCRLGLRRARHAGIGLCRRIYLTLGGDRVASFEGVIWQRNSVAVRLYLVRFNVESDEVSGTEACSDGNISCVAARSHENSAEPRVIVARVKVDPSASKKNLIPGAEISGTAKWLTDVPDVAGNIAGWNIHATSECNGEMLEISADANSLDEDIRGGLGRSRGVVVKADTVMHPIADGHRAFPSRLGGSELIVGDGAELVDLPIPARQEEPQNV
jgi:hypothetical protein